MIPFDKIYSWLFKSFNIAGETEIIQGIIQDGHKKVMIVKRSWIFALFQLWMPLAILGLSSLSIMIAYGSIGINSIKYTLIGGNVVMSLILIFSTFNYIRYFRRVYHEATIVTDLDNLKKELHQGDEYFRTFFNWSITNQLILIFTIVIEIILMIVYRSHLGDHFWILSTDILVMCSEIHFSRAFRKKMIDLEMDYNIVVAGKMYFINQSGLLSSIQTIEGDKIKTIQSLYPGKFASFFNYGTVHILTEGDDHAMMIGTMTMYYVTNPDGVVSRLHNLLDEYHGDAVERVEIVNPGYNTPVNTPSSPTVGARTHTMDTREKIRDVLR